MSKNLIKCNSIKYRQGYIEVRSDIHDNCVNIEVWNIHPDTDISGINLYDDVTLEEAVVANTEVELSIENAEYLVQKLINGITAAREKNNT